MQSIELLLDPEGDRAVRAGWAALAAAGLPSLASHTGETNRPHVTLIVAEDGLEQVAERCRALLRDVDLPVLVGAPLLFGGHRNRWVLARQVVTTRALLQLQAAVHDAAAQHAPDAALAPHCRPGEWTPHITIAHRIPAVQLPDALAVLALEPVPVLLRDARLWDSPSATVTALN